MHQIRSHSARRPLGVWVAVALATIALALPSAPARAGGEGGSTLGFVIDRSGSMNEEIDAVADAVAEIVAAVAGSPTAPVEYLLQLYADPDVGFPFVTDDPDELLAATEAIERLSGGDCPELAHAALLSAVGAARPGGRLFLFTDAGAKDGERAGTVAASAAAKGVRVSFVLTGGCGDEADPAFFDIASETGGQVFLLDEADLGVLFAFFEPGLAGDLEPILLAERELDLGVPRTWSIPVDATQTSLTVSGTVETLTALTIRRPGGAVVAPADPDATVTSFSTGAVVTLDAPAAGTWEIELEGHGLVYVSAAGRSPLALRDFGFVEAGPGSLERIHGLPLAGENAVYLAEVPGPYQDVALEARDLRAAVLAPLPADSDDPLAGPDELLGFVPALPSGSFRVYATGTATGGFPFQRVFPPAFRAQSVHVEPPDDAPLPPGGELEVVFVVTNLGSPGSFSFSAADEQGLVVGVQPGGAALATDVPTQVTVTISTAGGAQPGEDTLTLVAQRDDDPAVHNYAQTLLGVEPGGACSPAPRADCLATTSPGAGKLSLKSRKGKLSFSWKKGEATALPDLGDPLGGTEYAFCLYATKGGVPSGRVLAETIAPGARWKAKKSGFRWKAAKGAPGLSKLSLKAGDAGKAKLKLTGKSLALPGLPVDPDEGLVAQLAAGTGACWSADFASPLKKNTSSKLVAKSQ